MKRNSIDEYIGPSGGFFSTSSRYVGVTHQAINLSASGNAELGSSNGDVHISSSGSMFISAGENMIQSSSGSFKIISEADTVDLHGQDISIGAISAVGIGGGTDIDINAGQAVNVQALNEVHIIGDLGIVFATDQKGLVIPTSLGTGSISGQASERMYFAASGDAHFRSDNGDLLLLSSGAFTLASFNDEGTISADGELAISSSSNRILVISSDETRVNAGTNIILVSTEDISSLSSQETEFSSSRSIALNAIRRVEAYGDDGVILRTDAVTKGTGHISGIAQQTLFLAGSGLTCLRSDNGDLQLFGSGIVNCSAGGQISITSATDRVLVSAFDDVSLAPDQDFTVVAGEGISMVSEGDDIVVRSAIDKRIIAYGDDGIVLRTDATTKDTGSISGVAVKNIFLSASGAMKLHCENGSMAVSSSGQISFGSIDGVTAGTFGGAFIVDKVGNYTGVWGGTWSNSSNIIAMSTTGGVGIYSAAGNATFKSTAANATLGSDVGDVTCQSSQAQVTLSAFAASGRLRYEFGPHEAWHVSPSHTSDFFPIPHSGQIEEMISAGGGGGITSINGENGPAITLAASSGLRLTTGVDKITVSGVNQYVSVYNNTGTIGLIAAGGANPTSYANVAMDSVIRLDPIFQGTGAITVLKTGWYKLNYNINLDNSANASRTIAQVRARNTTAGADIRGSHSYPYLRTNAAGENTGAVAGLLFHADAGDAIEVQARRISGTGNVSVNIDSSINLEYIGDWNDPEGG